MLTSGNAVIQGRWSAALPSVKGQAVIAPVPGPLCQLGAMITKKSSEGLEWPEESY
jgi:hypothetical protein